MPWDASEAERHCKAADTPKKRKGWAEAANSAREKALKEGKSSNEADAIGVKVGNAAVSHIKEDLAVQRARFQEFKTIQPGPLKVDAEKGILYDVLFLGKSSRNRHDYSDPHVLEEAARQYEGNESYTGHTRDGSNPDPDKAFGVPKNCHVAPDGVRGDYHFPPKHRMAEDLVWRATNAPRSLGFSHDADCTYTVENGRKKVMSISRVYSVDLVTRPATTRGLFEDEEAAVASDPDLKTLAESSLAAMDNARSILFAADTDVATKRERLAEALAEWQHDLNNDAAPAASTLKEEEIHMDLKELTIESLTKDRPDLVEKLQGKDEHTRLTEQLKARTTEVATLTAAAQTKEAELATLKAKESRRLKEDEVMAELKAAKFPVEKPEIFTAEFKEELLAAEKPAREKKIAYVMGLIAGRLQEGIEPSPLTDFSPATAQTARVDHSYDHLFGAPAK